MTCQFGPDHPEFVLTVYPNGICEMEVCWDSTNVRQMAEDMRIIAAGLDALPPDSQAVGVKPL